jgi:hypothetical protein
LRALQVDSEIDLTSLEESVSNNLFAPKTGLMDKFFGKITELQGTLDQSARLAHKQSCRRRRA